MSSLLTVGLVLDGFRVEALAAADLTTETYRTVPVASAADARAVTLTISRGVPADPEVAQRFAGEVARLTAVTHPALVAVHGGGTLDGRPYMIADAVGGTPLRGWLAERGPLRAAAVALLHPVAEALDELHAHGLLHRGLGPSAVVVDRRGRAKLRLPGPPRVPGTPDGTVTGDLADELAGLSPEQRTGTAPSHRSDVFGLGTVLYEAVTGVPPLDVEGVLAGRTPPPASAVLPGLPPAVDDVLARAMATEPSERQGSARRLTDELAAAFETVRPGRPPRGRRPWVLVVGATLAVAAVAAVVAVPVVRDRLDAAPTVTDSFAPRVDRDMIVGEPVAVGADPADVEAGAGAVWVSAAGGTLTRIDPATGATREITVGGQPGQIVVTDEAVWVRNLGDRITRVDTATGAVSEPIPGGGRVTGMAVGGGSVWLAHSADNTVTRIDARTLQPVGDPIGVGGGPRAMEYADGVVYVLNADDSTMTRIDAASGRVVGAPLQLGEGLGGIEVDDGTVYVAAGDGVTPVQAATFTAGEPFDLRGWSYFEVADGTMWLVLDEADEVRRLDLATRQQVGTTVPGVGSDVGRARFAFGMLWLTRTGTGTVVRIAPAR